MWVRSQDKKRLTNVEDVRILEQNNGDYNIWGNNNCNLGKYSTEEKALKVLDMIEQSVSGFIDEEVAEFYQYGIFQMPQDSEV